MRFPPAYNFKEVQGSGRGTQCLARRVHTAPATLLQPTVICWQICAVCRSSLHAASCLRFTFRGEAHSAKSGDAATQWPTLWWPEP